MERGEMKERGEGGSRTSPRGSSPLRMKPGSEEVSAEEVPAACMPCTTNKNASFTINLRHLYNRISQQNNSEGRQGFPSVRLASFGPCSCSDV